MSGIVDGWRWMRSQRWKKNLRDFSKDEVGVEICFVLTNR
jgi:hypothetical protein